MWKIAVSKSAKKSTNQPILQAMVPVCAAMLLICQNTEQRSTYQMSNTSDNDSI